MGKITNTPTIAATITGLDSGDPTLALAFVHGETLEIRPSQLRDTILRYALMHGLKQKLVDAAAISRNPETGRAASATDKCNAVKEVYYRLLAGEWNKVRAGGAGTSGGLLFRALCRMYDGRKSADELRIVLAAKTDAEKAALRKNPKVAGIIEEIRAESAGGDDDNEVDADSLLAELDGDDDGDDGDDGGDGAGL